MNAFIHPLRRGIALGCVATATVFAGGCFQVEEVAQQPASGEATADGEPELNIAMGDEAGPLDLNAGPLDLNVDATVGDVSPADFAGASFGSSSEVPDAPQLSGSIPAQPSSFAPTPPAASTTPSPPAAPLTDSSAESFDAPEFAPSASGFEGSSNPAPPLQGFAPVPSSNDFGGAEFQPSGEAPGLALSALPDTESGSPVEPMTDPEATFPEANAVAEADGATDSNAIGSSPLAPAPEIFDLTEAGQSPLAPSASPAPGEFGGLLPANDEPSTVEESADPPVSGLSESNEDWAEGSNQPDVGAESLPEVGFAPPALAGEEPEPESVDAAPAPEALASEPAAEVADTEAEGAPAEASLAEADANPFEEDVFAPRFGPGRQLAEASPRSTAPPTIPTPEPALDPEAVEEETPSVLAQERPSPAVESLAVQLVDPSAPPPASFGPTAQPNAALPAFNPTIGDALDPSTIIDDEDYTPTPPGDEAPGATPRPLGTPGPAPGPDAPSPGPAAPRALPMPGPARDDEAEEAVPAPPATSRPADDDDASPEPSSTPAEIAEAARSWTDASGSHTLEAAILEYDKGEVRLQTPKGERYVVSLTSLSRYDQGYVKGLAEGTVGKEPASRSWSDASGSFSLDGVFVETDGDVVRIGRGDGKTFRIEKRQLAAYDRGYVDGLADAERQ